MRHDPENRTFIDTRYLQTESLPIVVHKPLLKRRYKILERLGEGGFSTVYRAQDIIDGRIVAIKAITFSRFSGSRRSDAVKTFYREIEMLACLRHRSLPRIHSYFATEDCLYLVMDYIPGYTLEQYLEQLSGRLLPLEVLFEIALLLCDVLAYLHCQPPPVVFRDLKPANIMLTPDGHLFLIDFGIARRYHAGQGADTIPFGSPGYAAPEQYGHVQTTPRSDIYSLGVLLHFLLSGEDPVQSQTRITSFKYSSPIENQLARLIHRMTISDIEMRSINIHAVRAGLQNLAYAHSRVQPSGTLPTICRNGRMRHWRADPLWLSTPTRVPQWESMPERVTRPDIPRLNSAITKFVPPTDPSWLPSWESVPSRERAEILPNRVETDRSRRESVPFQELAGKLPNRVGADLHNRSRRRSVPSQELLSNAIYHNHPRWRSVPSQELAGKLPNWVGAILYGRPRRGLRLTRNFVNAPLKRPTYRVQSLYMRPVVQTDRLPTSARHKPGYRHLTLISLILTSLSITPILIGFLIKMFGGILSIALVKLLILPLALILATLAALSGIIYLLQTDRDNKKMTIGSTILSLCLLLSYSIIALQTYF